VIEVPVFVHWLPADATYSVVPGKDDIPINLFDHRGIISNGSHEMVIPVLQFSRR